MSITTDSIKRYNAAQYRFFKPAVVNFYQDRSFGTHYTKIPGAIPPTENMYR
jgi:hypothetical protein